MQWAVLSPDLMSAKRVAVVTGKAIALQLAADEFDLVLNDLKFNKAALDVLAEEVSGIGPRALAITGDVSVERNVMDMIDKAINTFGGVDVISVRIPLNW
jgi:NAD(P)-dependent dehydrogenase (short-subunit alcohol dehydrogenase family)